MRAGSVWRRIVAVSAVAVTADGMSSASTSDVPASEGAYANAVTEGAVGAFPDPVTLQGKGGAWYAYGTTNPVFESRGEQGQRYLPILRSDLDVGLIALHRPGATASFDYFHVHRP